MTNAYWPATEPDSLGGMIGADDVRDAMKATIDTWQAYYLGVLSARLTGRIGGAGQPPNPLQPFGTWANEPNFRSIGTGMPAAYLVTVPGTVGAPHLLGDGNVTTIWRAQVSVQVFGTDWQTTADLTSWYEKVVRWCVLQHRSLGGFAQTSKWMGTSYNGKAHSSTRTEGVVTAGFDLTVDNTVNVGRGPSAVPANSTSPGADPTVLYPILDLTKIPDSGTLP